MEKKNCAIRFKLFGHFSASYGDRELKLDKSATTKVMQMLALLVFYKDGISREELLQNLYGDKEIADRNNNLRVTMFKLRKLLVQAGLPEGSYVTVQNDIFKWSPEIPTECDVWQFRDDLAAAAAAETPERELCLLKDACALYTDELLSPIGYEEWVVMESVALKKEYARCLRRLCDMLDSIGAYQEIDNLCAVAERIYPYDEWQMVRIDALMALNRYDEALALYQEFVERRFDELGLAPTPEMVECNRKINEAMESRLRSADDIYMSLVEKEADSVGAVYVSYSSFIDRFRFLQRISERSGESNYLVVANISTRTGKAAEAVKAISQVDEIIRVILRHSLRRSDTFTKYNSSQYLLLLVGIDMESIKIVTGRINEKLQKEAKGWKLSCRYRALPMHQPEAAVKKLGWEFSPDDQPEGSST